MLKKQFYEIDPTKEISLQTLHGSIIRIPAGAFSVSEKIKLEIREAFTPAEILTAGMITESNGRPLKSGGMIYVSATANDKPVELLKPINISIPNNYYDSSMKVFKGVESDSGTVNWVNPLPIDSTLQSQQWALGKMLFQKCASCHSIFRDRAGPALINVENRGPWTDRRNLYHYIRNASKMVQTVPYLKNLKTQFGNAVMTSFPALSDSAIDAILLYINTEAKNPSSNEIQIPIAAVSDTGYSESTIAEPGYMDSPAPAVPVASVPCKDDTAYGNIPPWNYSYVDSVSESNNTSVNLTEPEYKGPIAKTEQYEGLRTGFTDPIGTYGMYDFSIKTLGWYNIDALVEGYEGTSIVNVTAEMQGEYAYDINIVYLFCPRNKTLSVSNDFEGLKFSYKKINDGIPLFINDNAILFAFGSKGDKIFYGISEFKVGFQQTIPITIRESTDEEIRKALLSKQMDGIDLGLEKKEMRIIKKACNDSTFLIDSISDGVNDYISPQ
jgi:cytochrome c2